MIQRKMGQANQKSPRVHDIDTQYFQNDGSIMEYSAEHGYEVGRELIKLLDAVYTENK